MFNDAAISNISFRCHFFYAHTPAFCYFRSTILQQSPLKIAPVVFQQLPVTFLFDGAFISRFIMLVTGASARRA